MVQRHTQSNRLLAMLKQDAARNDAVIEVNFQTQLI